MPKKDTGHYLQRSKRAVEAGPGEPGGRRGGAEKPDQPNSAAQGDTLNRMRIPTSDGAGQRGTRRRGRGAQDPGSDRDTVRPDAARPDIDRDTGSRDTGWRHAAGGHADGNTGNARGAGTRTDPPQYPAGSAGGGSTGRTGAAAASSLFAPGYDGSPAAGDAVPPRSGAHGSSSWYGSAAGGAAGKGPVRGFAPAPGQPPPMYPPGQFAAWNVGQDDRSRPGPQGGGQPDGGSEGRSRRDGGQPDPIGRPPVQPAADSRYYDSSDAEPGYSVLAVSDPAADVTSTQTWKAVGDGRSTGTWTSPARPGAGPGGPRAGSGRHSAPPGVARPGAASPDPASTDRAGTDSASTGPAGLAPAGLAPARPEVTSPDRGRAGRAAPDAAGRDGASRDSVTRDRASLDSVTRDRAIRDRASLDRPGRERDNQDGEQRRAASQSGAGRSGAHSSPHATVRTERGPQTEPRPSRAKSPAGGKRSARRKRPASVKLAISVALLLVLTAAATLAYTVLHKAAKPPPAAAPARSGQPTVSPSPSQSPSLGPYGHIASRQSDSEPLTVGQLFPASFTTGGQTVTRAASAITKHCRAALSGSRLQSAVSSAHCNQAVRATYLARSKGLMGTIGVLNLSTAARAVKAVKAADASDFISQLKGKHGPTHRIGSGTGIEEALAKGHYLILIWAEFTNLHKPKAAAQRNKVENFMTEMLQHTANVSLATRMLTGSP